MEYFFGGNGWLLAYQVTAIVSVTTFSAVVTFIILVALRFTVGLTYDKENLSQIDLFQHGTLIKKESIVKVQMANLASETINQLGIEVTTPKEENSKKGEVSENGKKEKTEDSSADDESNV